MKKVLFSFVLLLTITLLQAQPLKIYTDIVTNKSGLKDANGKVVVKNMYDAIIFGHEGMIAMNLGGTADSRGFGTMVYGGLWGFMDSTGKKVTEPVYEKTGEFYDGLVTVQKNGKWGIINKTGKVVIPIKYEDISAFSEGFAKIVLNKKAGYINKSGVTVIKPQYGFAGFFSQGLAAVSVEAEGGKYGYINKLGKLVIPFQFSTPAEFKNDGTARVFKDEREYKIDKTGKEVN